MVVAKVIMDKSGGLEYLRNAIWYLKYDTECHMKKNDDGEWEHVVRDDFVMLNGWGVNWGSLLDVYKQMVMVKQWYGRERLNSLIHIVVCFDKNNGLKTCVENCRLFSREIGEVWGYQNIWALHRDEKRMTWYGSYVECYHAHFLLNTVSCVDGKPVHVNRSFVWRMINALKIITEDYVNGIIDNKMTGKEWNIPLKHYD